MFNFQPSPELMKQLLGGMPQQQMPPQGMSPMGGGGIDTGMSHTMPMPPMPMGRPMVQPQMGPPVNMNAAGNSPFGMPSHPPMPTQPIRKPPTAIRPQPAEKPGIMKQYASTNRGATQRKAY